ncbi:putative PurR-regulated permease PerM [Rhizomicrobium palustre]|uniref:Putative PurR-regulated permease PerM n=1 Tax=Rhizomicrobium palustre TaxID=189966 RepID=A0A846MX83_9PROT|nr:AI-2E family transporter [Rhizomicrobium palustre]NIK87751.1 putative PurR-regulated permease PerM [Rhizomicrobium palustre]
MTDSDYEAPHGSIPHKPSADAVFVRRALLGGLVVGLLLALWQVSLVLILTFGGIVVAVALRNLAGPLGRWLKVPDRVALLITVLDVSFIALGFFYFFGAMAAHQFSSLIARLPQTLDSAKILLGESLLGRQILAALDQGGNAAERLTAALPLAGGILGGLGEAALMIVVGIYLAADPPLYIHGVLRLVPPRRRTRTLQILNAVGEALQKWLLGMTLDMLLLGVMTFIGLWAIGVPLPFALAVLSGVAVFVPYIGPAIAMIPGLLLAFSVRPILALYAAGVYTVVLTIEAYVSQPLLQRWAVSLPAIFNLLAILVFAPLFGIWGAILATPLSVALWVLVQKIYIEDVLDDRKG